MVTPASAPSDSGGLLARLFSTAAMERVFSDANLVQQMLRFECALQLALEDCGLAPAGSARPLAALLESEFLTAERAGKLQSAAALSGNLAIPFVNMLTAAVAEDDPSAARFIHTGATSQDVLDTALVLQMQQALALIDADLGLALARCVALAREHADTVVAGRTWLQQGPPVTLGLQFAACAAAFSRHRQRLREAADRAVVLQFGGAVGTLASLGKDGIEVSAALALHLELPEPPAPWHSHRDNLAEIAGVLGLLTGTLGKMARDISLGMQTEVGEVFEPAGQGRGGSSTMPHKRNPVGSAAVLAAALRVPSLVATMLVAMPQEHERGLGGWHAEWETLPEIFRLTAGALHQMREILDGLEVHVDRMTANLDITRGLVLAEAVSSALAEKLGRAGAHRLVEEASRRALQQGSSLEQVLLATPEVAQQLPPERIHELLDRRNYLGSSAAFLDRTLRALDKKAG